MESSEETAMSRAAGTSVEPGRRWCSKGSSAHPWVAELLISPWRDEISLTTSFRHCRRLSTASPSHAVFEDCGCPSSAIGSGKPVVGDTLSIKGLCGSRHRIDPGDRLRLRVEHVIADHFPFVIVMVMMVVMIRNNDNIEIV